MPEAPIRDNIPLDGMGDGAYLIGNFDNNRTNVQGMLAAKATEYRPGTVLGKITASGLFTPLNPSANDGSQNFAGILYGRRPAKAAATQRAAVTVREATVNGNLLIYEVAVNATQKAAAEAQASAAGVIIGY